MDKTSGEKTSRAPRNAQIDSEKARLRNKLPRNPSLPRRYVSAASPFCFAFHTDIALRRMPVPFFSRRGKQRSVQGPLQPLQTLQPPQPRQNGAPAPRAEEISGALSPAAQRQRRTRARQRTALSRRPRGRTGVFYPRFMEKAKAASTASAPPAVRRPAAALRCGALRHGGAASAIWSGQAESG